MNKKIARKLLEKFNSESGRCFQGTYFNVENFNESFIFRILNQATKFRTISEDCKVKKTVGVDRTLYEFYEKDSNKLKSRVVVLDSGNIVEPRSPYECLTNPYVWYVKLRFYTDKPKKYYPKSKWTDITDSIRARIYSKGDSNYVRIRDKYNNQIQMPKKEVNGFIDLSKIKEFKSPKKDIYAFKSDIIEDPKILGKKVRGLAEKYGVSRQTIYNWKEKLEDL